MTGKNGARVISADQQRSGRLAFGILREYGIILAFLAVFVTLSLLTPAFFTVRNMLNVLDQASQVGLVALGATVTIIGGGFDLSAGAIFAATGATAALIARQGYRAAGLAVGVLVGLIQASAPPASR